MPQPIPLSLLLLVGTTVATVLVLALAVVRNQHTQLSPAAILNLVENIIGRFLMVGMLFAATLQVLSRYWLSQYFTLPWTEEFSRLLMVWAGLWGAAMVQKSDDHISVTLLTDFLPQTLRNVVRIFNDLVILAVLLFVFWFSLDATRSLSDLYSIALGMPMLVFAAAVPTTSLLMIIYTVAHLIGRLRDRSANTNGLD